MFLNFLTYYLFILLFLILYAISFIETISGLLKKEFTVARLKVIMLLIPFLTLGVVERYNSELFKSKKVLSALYIDDLFSYILIFREDGSCECEISGFYGYEETIEGKYYFKGDTVIFTTIPYNNDFIPDRLLIDRKEGTLYARRDSKGGFIRNTSNSDVFKIIEND